MSTIKTTNITHGSNSGTNNIILDDTGKVTVAEKKLVSPGTILQVKNITTQNTFQESVAAGATSSNNVLNLYFQATSTSNRLLVTMGINVCCSTNNIGVGMALYADGSIVSDAVGATASSRNLVTAAGIVNYTSHLEPLNAQVWLTPASTSNINYSIRLINLHSSTHTLTANYSSVDTDSSMYARSVSSMTIMEISQ